MDLQLRDQLIRDEGIRLKPYRDTVGKLTIGVGRNLDDVGISFAEANYLLENDINATTAALTHAFPWFPRLDSMRQRALINLGFMGIEKLKTFAKMLRAIERGDYDTAADELLESKYAAQVGNRALRLAEMIRTGEPPA